MDGVLERMRQQSDETAVGEAVEAFCCDRTWIESTITTPPVSYQVFDTC